MKSKVTSTLMFFLVLTSQFEAQTPEINQWNTDGNITTEDHFIGTQNNNPLKFKSNNIERLRISPDGKVGIGICTPTAKLDVSGDVLFRNNINFTGLSTTSNSNNEILIIDSLGVVSKSSISEISNAIYSTKYCDEGPIFSPTWSNGENKIFVACPQVNVGINTSQPRVNLDVLGTTYTNSLKLGAVDPLNSIVKFHMKTIAPSNSIAVQLLIESEQQELLKLNYQGLLTSKCQIIHTGNANVTPLIISNSSQKLLQVDNDGLLHARRIKVDADSWADFVFDENYKLMPISELKKFIENHDHLPNIPSEKEVLETGIDLLEMNKLLLQKIEELTQYIINQHEEIETLKKVVNE